MPTLAYSAAGLAAVIGLTWHVYAADPVTVSNPPPKTSTAKPIAPSAAKTADSATLLPLNKQETVLLDQAGKRLLLKSRVCLNKGQLELLCCVKNTKEHEAILSVDSRAQVIHAGLLALGIEQGKPVEFDPVYKPPTGQQIDIFVNWKDAQGKAHRVPAQEWIRYVVYKFYLHQIDALPPEVKLTGELDELRYDPKTKDLIWYGPMSAEKRKQLLALTKDESFRTAIESFYKRSQSRAMEAHWVFAGSGFFEDEQTKKKVYRAEDGDLICVANFNSATLDIASKSSAGNEDLLFEAWTEQIPPIDTEVLIELIPVPKEKAPAAPKAPEKKAAAVK